ncbi:MAG: pyridoxal-phosphate dependent enzyme [Alphaproteobacteria bacterium]|nr:pyridoxal-phosphate dependent enzyme [Alphaproteobacteria bacterium]
MSEPPITLGDIEATRDAIAPWVIETPVVRWAGREMATRVGADTEVWLKLELMQVAGSFKPRGSLNNLLGLDAAARKRGVTAISAGNHAIAVAFAARELDANAKVVMPVTANPFRVARCRELGAEVVLSDDIGAAFEEVKRIEAEEGKTFVHPFEGRATILGTATVGLELMTQLPDLDAVVVPVGGGGLISGVARAVKLISPDCTIYGVEPEGAPTLTKSLAAGEPQAIDAVRTIADSLGAPHAAPMSFGLIRDHVEEIVLVDDDALRAALALLFTERKLAAEPASAASTAALLGPLKDKLAGKRVALIVSGANIDLESYAKHVGAGLAPSAA